MNIPSLIAGVAVAAVIAAAVMTIRRNKGVSRTEAIADGTITFAVIAAGWVLIASFVLYD